MRSLATPHLVRLPSITVVKRICYREELIDSAHKMSNKDFFAFLFITLMASMRPIYCHRAVHMSVTPDPRCCDSYDAHRINCITDVDLSSIENVTSLTVYSSQGDIDNEEFKPVAAVQLGKPDLLLVCDCPGFVTKISRFCP
ncbi:hypothetical protein ElyMa_002125200 [Elysia marginata]|uniref:Uncharacterized protein n=1 Tax=Elysia marginata TaxID=1093978 RepID=A0AAV4FI22_9GAST|nr:hypothetical protein ElyMa_002125200 [Elysia marginata]